MNNEKKETISVLVEMHREPFALISSTGCIPPALPPVPHMAYPKTGQTYNHFISSGSIQEDLTLEPAVDNSSILSFSTLNSSEEYRMQIKRAYPYYPSLAISDGDHSCSLLGSSSIPNFPYPRRNDDESSASAGYPLVREPDRLYRVENIFGPLKMVLIFYSIITYVADVVTDGYTAYTHFHKGDYWYGAFTLLLIVIPGYTMSVISWRWRSNWRNRNDEKAACHQYAELFLHIIPASPIYGHLEAFWIGNRSRKHSKRLVDLCDLGKDNKWEKLVTLAMYMQSVNNEGSRHVQFSRVCQQYICEKEKERAKIMLYIHSCHMNYLLENEVNSQLCLFESFTEAAPQLFLQLYIISKEPINFETKFTSEIMRTISVIFSGFSLANGLRSLNSSRREKYIASDLSIKDEFQGLKWYHFILGDTSFTFGQFFGIFARVIALSLFASVNIYWMIFLVSAHFLLMSTCLIWKSRPAVTQTNILDDKEKNEQGWPFSCIPMAFVYIFTYIKYHDGSAIQFHSVGLFWNPFYYMLCLVENSVMMVLWWQQTAASRKYIFIVSHLCDDQRHLIHWAIIAIQLSLFFLSIGLLYVYEHLYLRRVIDGLKIQPIFSVTTFFSDFRKLFSECWTCIYQCVRYIMIECSCVHLRSLAHVSLWNHQVPEMFELGEMMSSRNNIYTTTSYANS